MTFITAYAGVSAVCTVILWAICAAAPLGWQDDRGFHVGEQAA